MATDLEREAVEKLSEAVDALSLNVARLSERLDAQRETLTEAMRASQEETRRMMAEQNAAQAQEFHAAIERLDDRTNWRMNRVRVPPCNVEQRTDRFIVDMDRKFASLSTKLNWLLAVEIAVLTVVAAVHVLLFFD